MLKRILASLREQRGAVIVEASISLFVFVFTMLTLLSVIRICYAQAKMTIAVQLASKQVAEFAHVYYATHLSEHLQGGSGKSSEVFDKLSDFAGKVGKEVKPYSEDVSKVLDQIGKDLGNTSGIDIIKQMVGSGTLKILTELNLKNSSTGSAEQFYKYVNMKKKPSFHAEDFLYKGKNIFIKADYEVEIIQFFKLPVTFKLNSYAFTQAWGGE